MQQASSLPAGPARFFVVALHNFVAEHETELSLKENDVIKIVATGPDWWEGTLNGYAVHKPTFALPAFT